ncbi:MAG: hypothetical protein NT091_03595, partial [Candidatus Falkowbacteria bacterium]|nr:hypothetical protein [Candidatus Falkowbacteria bacterium]
RGFGWNGNDTDGVASTSETGLGWLSFNCLDAPGGCSSPLVAGYRVMGDFVNNFPKVASLTAPNWSYAEGCSAYGSLQSFLQWNFSDRDIGSCETAYQIVVNDINSTSTPLLDTGKCQGTYFGGVCAGGSNTGACQSTVTANRFNLRAAMASASSTEVMKYDKRYYWWVKVWDDRDLASDWTQYSTVTDTDNDDANPLTFATYKHKFPNPSFSWFPVYPNIGENVSFTDTSKVYANGVAHQDIPSNCSNGTCFYAWTFEQGMPNNSTDRNPSPIRFTQGGSMNVTVKTTDQDGYYCYNTANVENVSVCLPLWQEKKP